jgi:hypothetical protein
MNSSEAQTKMSKHRLEKCNLYKKQLLESTSRVKELESQILKFRKEVQIEHTQVQSTTQENQMPKAANWLVVKITPVNQDNARVVL